MTIASAILPRNRLSHCQGGRVEFELEVAQLVAAAALAIEFGEPVQGHQRDGEIEEQEISTIAICQRSPASAQLFAADT